MKKKILYLPIETKAREYRARLLFALQAAAKGYQSLIGHYPLIRDCMYRSPPGIHIDVDMSKHDLLHDLHQLGYKYAVIDEEGPIFESDSFNRYRAYPKHAKYIDQYFAWGEYHSSLARTAMPELPSISIVGNMRFEMLKEKYHSLYEHEVQLLREQYGDFVLINTNIGLFNHFVGPQAVYKLLESTGNLDEKAKARLDRLYEHEIGVYESFRSLIQFLSSNLKSTNIVIRYHPVEKKETWEALCSSNVFAESKGSVIPWILASRAVIQRGCTTGIESTYLNKPVITYRTTDYSSEFDREIVNDMGFVISNEKAVLDAIMTQDADAVKMKLTADKKLLSHHISNMNPDENVAQSMISVLDNLDVPLYDDSSELFDTSGIKKQTVYLKIKNIARPYIKRWRTNMSALTLQKFPGLEKEEIERDIESLAPFVNIPNDSIKISKIHKNVFHITVP